MIHVEVTDDPTSPKGHLAKTLRRQLRATDSIGDLGGGGLLIALPDTGAAFADSLAAELTGLLKRTGESHLVASTEAAGVGQREDVDAFVTWLRDRGSTLSVPVAHQPTHSWYIGHAGVPPVPAIATPRYLPASTPRLSGAVGLGCLWVALLACLILAPRTWALSPFPELGNVTNGTVNAVTHSEGVTYIGGAFSQVGPATGPGVAIGLGTGKDLEPAAAWAGSAVIDAVAQDEKGGFFIGGSFTHVGGVVCSNLAYIESTGQLNRAGVPSPNGTVQALTFSGATVYAGGAFTEISGSSREHIAAICATAKCEGEVAAGNPTAWNPKANGAAGKRLR